MTHIIDLMNQLNLSEEVITCTVSKITLICCKNDIPLHFNSLNNHEMYGNGNGNGNN
jgi:hypothetical protein